MAKADAIAMERAIAISLAPHVACSLTAWLTTWFASLVHDIAPFTSRGHKASHHYLTVLHCNSNQIFDDYELYRQCSLEL